jgi:hypothetical protein
MNSNSTFRAALDEVEPLVGVSAVYGPPVIVLAVPWLLLALMLAGPFTVLVTFAVLFAAVAALVGLIGALLTAPYLVFRHFRRARATHASKRVPAPRIVVGGSQ